MTGAVAMKTRLMTVEEFLDWDGGGHPGKMELVNGIVVAMAPTSATHGIIQLSIGRALAEHIQKNALPCRVGTEMPILPPMDKGKNARVTDIAVARRPVSADRPLEEPLLIVEVMSPTNEAETWASIQAIAGLPSLQEILVVQSTRVEAEVYRRSPGGAWPNEPNVVVRELAGSIRLDSLELDLTMAAICWQTHLAAGPGR
ncbi:MAG: Uma2 family endonuclease [Hyphomicrobiaceae bacterium]|nr:Uma2 family endonuclease [Hyphomicrobiaceae bacterium]